MSENKIEFEEIITEIWEERQRQDEIHPNFPKNDFERLAILNEEFLELVQGLNDGDLENVEEELIQIASVCIRWYSHVFQEKNIKREKNQLKNKLNWLLDSSNFWLSKEEKKKKDELIKETKKTIKEKGFFDLLEDIFNEMD